MQVDFFRLTKKSNSTKRPTGSALASFDCVLKDGCSIMNPVIMLETGLVNRPNYNYCHIDAFGRWYFITDWTFTRRLWVASLACDVLATFKPTIGAMNLYMLRSSARSNGKITDNRYPILAQPYTYIDPLGSTYEEVGGQDHAVPNFFNTSLNDGFYYIGITGANGTGVSWYVCTPTGFNRLVNDLYNLTPADMSDVSSGVAMQLADPMQYIVTCYWLPSLIYGVTLNNDGVDLKFGRFTQRLYQAASFDPVTSIHRYHADFTIRKHPQAATRGAYLNQGPFTRYTVVFPPFGTFELDASLMIDDAAATCEWYIDYSTGLADLTIKVTNSFMVHTSAPFGVPIQLNQAMTDIIGAGSSLVGGMIGAAAGVISGNWGGAIMSATSGIAGGVGAMQPKVGSKGSTGSFIPFKALAPKIYTDFYLIADEDNADMGRPLCEVTTPATLGSGFMMAAESHFENEYALENEIDQINAYIEGGFFYE